MKHHHVPQFLLKRWALKPDEKIQVFHLDLQHCPSSRRKPKYTGFEDDLYAMNDPQVKGIDRQALEKDHLATVDDRAANVLSKMEGAEFSELTEKDCCFWLDFIMLFPWRNPDAISTLNIEGSKHLMASLEEQPEQYDEIAESSDPPTLAEWTKVNYPDYIENFGKMCLPRTSKHPTLAKHVERLTWNLLTFSDQNHHLLLADRPCIFSPNLKHPDLVIALPIGPWKAFIATKNVGTAQYLAQQRQKDLILRINESSLGQAKKYIWAVDASPCRFISNRLHSR